MLAVESFGSSSVLVSAMYLNQRLQDRSWLRARGFSMKEGRAALEAAGDELQRDEKRSRREGLARVDRGERMPRGII